MIREKRKEKLPFFPIFYLPKQFPHLSPRKKKDMNEPTLISSH